MLTKFKDKLNALCKFMTSKSQKDQNLIANLITVNKRIRRILKDDNKPKLSYALGLGLF